MSLLGKVIGGAISAITPNAVTDGVQSIKDWYNEKDLMIRIEKKYEECLGVKWPAELKLETLTYDDELDKISNSTHTTYKIISDELVGTIKDYLEKRAKRSFWSNGKKNDPLKCFLYEWRRWAIGTLAKLDSSDPNSSKEIKTRLHYLTEILTDNKEFFKTGIYTRENTKFDTFEKMKGILDRYKHYKSIREKQKSVHAKLFESLDPASTYYANSLKFCYLAADFQSHENTFIPERFYDFNKDKSFLSRSAIAIFTRLHKSVKGSILKNILDMSFLNFTNTSKTTEPATKSRFYNFHDKFESNVNPNLEDNDKDSFPWSTTLNQPEHLQAFQNLGRDVLNISELNAALEQAVSQTGNFGNTWACGPGEKSLLDMMDDYESALKILDANFKSYFETHSNLSRAYFKNNSSAKLKDHWNDNFKEMNLAYMAMQSAAKKIRRKFKVAKKKLSLLPASDTENNDISLSLHNRNARRRGLPMVSSLSSPRSLEARANAARAKFESDAEILKKRAEALKYKLIQNNLHVIIERTYFKEINAKIRLCKNAFSPVWKDQSYQNWMDGFTTRNSAFYKRYNEVLANITKILQSENLADPAKQKEDIEIQNRILASLFQELNKKISDEAPGWKFEWSGSDYLPVIRLGKPFNRKARDYANLLMHDSKNQCDHTVELMNLVLELINSYKPENRHKSNNEFDFALAPEPAPTPEPAPSYIPFDSQNATEALEKTKRSLAESKARVEEAMRPYPEELQAEEKNEIATVPANLISLTELPSISAPAALVEDDSPRMSSVVVIEEVKEESIKVPVISSSKSKAITDELKEEKVQPVILESFTETYKNLFYKFLLWMNTKSSSLILFKDEATLLKFWENGIDHKAKTDPVIFEDNSKGMRLIMSTIEKFMKSLSQKDKVKYKSSVIQIKLFSALLNLFSETNSELYETNLRTFIELRKKVLPSNLLILNIHKHGRSNSTSSMPDSDSDNSPSFSMK